MLIQRMLCISERTISHDNSAQLGRKTMTSRLTYMLESLETRKTHHEGLAEDDRGYLGDEDC